MNARASAGVHSDRSGPVWPVADGGAPFAGDGEVTSTVLAPPLNRFLPDPEQPRQQFDSEAMERLKAAIYAVGQLHRIRVRFTDEGWMIVDGQRRWLALCALAKEH